MNNSPVSAIGDGGLSGASLSLNNAGTPGRVPDQIARRNAFAGPGVHNLDARVSRQFPFFREGVKLELSAEAFNVVNHRNILAVTETQLAQLATTHSRLHRPLHLHSLRHPDEHLVRAVRPAPDPTAWQALLLSIGSTERNFSL